MNNILKLFLFTFLFSLFALLAVNAMPPAHALTIQDTMSTVIGDSLSITAKNDLINSLNTISDYIDAANGRTAAQGAAIVKGYQRTFYIPGTIVVFALGTNGGITQNDIDTVVNAVKTGDAIETKITTVSQTTPIIFMTIYAPAGSPNYKYVNTTNQLVQQAAINNPGRVYVADWNAIASANPAYTDANGNLTSKGAAAFANLFATVIQNIPDTSSTNGSGSTAQQQNNGATSGNTNVVTSGGITSNCATTTFGNGGDTSSLPAGCQPGTGGSDSGGTSSISNTSGLAYAAEALRQAYDFCGKDPYGNPDPGNTHVYPNIQGCLVSYLTSNFSNFAAAQISAMKDRWATSLWSSPDPSVDSRQCTQCLGFAGIASALWTGTTSNTLNFGCPAQEVNASTIQVGPYTFKNVGHGIGANVQPGDIGMSGTDPTCYGDAGHILIVKDVTGVQFTAIESNWGLTCHVTDDQTHTVDDFTFFRKE